MRIRTAALLLTGVGMTLQAYTQTSTLASLRDKARPLLVFAGKNDAQVERQYAILAEHAGEARERDMHIALLTRSRTKMHDGSQPPEIYFSPEEQQHIRQRFHIAPDDFTVLLIGKDGGEKLRSSTPIPWNKLASTIDAMPVRQAEMRPR